jgi:hypothetical protein
VENRTGKSVEEESAVRQSVQDAIGWALTKDVDLLFSVIAQDDGLLILHPDAASTVIGFDAFKALADNFWLKPEFKATHFEIRDLRVQMSRSGTVAWYSCFLDDFAEWDGREIGWSNVRWTGVVEKRGEKWVHVQMHFSFPTDRD